MILKIDIDEESSRKYDFTSKKVDVRDRELTIKEMADEGWEYNGERAGEVKNANSAIQLFFYKEKK